ncbi:hypothetical protein [Mangrovibacter plantisponsor]|uniref:Uncharacterized protein n=1 Tax=Mangrovibacter plantisponsor TaxID=451513 RepID=A0A317PV58_9ENTR|nr:hypothetical protein [Mangrovibacter plantisponsor]PWW06627.1 hypothetical protein DES37_11029 [Mangrovibacter plantisponsor]
MNSISFSSGKAVSYAACCGLCVFYSSAALALDTRSDNVSTVPVAPQESVARVDYNTILAQHIKASHAPMGNMVMWRDSSLPGEQSVSTHWQFPLNNNFATGPVAGWDQYRAPWSGSSAEASNVSRIGWRLDYAWGVIQPWAQVDLISGSSSWSEPYTAQSGQQDEKIGFSMGANLPLNQNIAAYARLSQGNTQPGNDLATWQLGLDVAF